MQLRFTQNMVAGFNDGRKDLAAIWYKSYYPEILKKIRQLTRGSSDSEDLAQDVVTIVLKEENKFETLRNIENYIDTVITRIYNKDQKKKNSRKGKTDGIIRHFKNREDESMDKANIREQFRHLQYLAMEMLPSQCKKVFHLYYHEGMRNREIAKLLNITEKTVEFHKSNAFRKLRLEIEKQAGGSRAMFLFILSVPVIICYLLIQKLLS